jgi:HAD superfamily hydrolase (TIGR01509 family)
LERPPAVGVGFDLDHTLAIDNKLERVAFLHLLEFLLERGGRTMGTLAEESDRIDDLLAHQRAGAFSIDDAVRRFVIERGVVASDVYVERFRALALEMAPAFVIPLPGAKRTIEALRERGVAVAVLSNGWNPLQEIKARRAGFDGPVLASAEIGTQKPDSRAFAALLEVLGTEPAATWYVGDDPYGDVEGAARAGLNAVWIDAEGKKYPPDLQPPPRSIRALEELLALVPGGGTL